MELDSDEENVNEEDFYTFLNIAKEVSKVKVKNLALNHVKPCSRLQKRKLIMLIDD